MYKYSKLIFDADNTLFDFDRAEETALVNTLEHFDMPVPTRLIEFYRGINVPLWQQLDAKQITIKQLKQKRAELLFDFVGQSADLDQFSHQYLEQLAEQVVLLPKVETTLKKLSNHCEMAIITNGLAHVQNKRFANCSIKHHFKSMVISEEVGFTKPEPEIFALTCEELGWNDPSEVLMVGDNYRCDIQGAANFGMRTCWYNIKQQDHSYTDHHYEIRSFGELMGLMC
jgi:2-haloacid dehalogenase